MKLWGLPVQLDERMPVDAIALVAEERGGRGWTLKLIRVVAPQLLRADPHLRSTIRTAMRHQIIDELAKRSGLPFHLAITNIVRWEEEERKHGPDPFLSDPGDEGVIVLVTHCTGGTVDSLPEG